MNTVKRTAAQRERSGAAAVECAAVAPLLALLLLGLLDMGQYVNTSQKISNASREGARVAGKHDTTSASQVNTVVLDYLSESLPGVSNKSLVSAINVKVSNEQGSPVADLSDLDTGSQVNVQVSLQYDAVRWLGGFGGIGGQTLTTTTTMRRE